jgi:hypothetical protein
MDQNCRAGSPRQHLLCVCARMPALAMHTCGTSAFICHPVVTLIHIMYLEKSKVFFIEAHYEKVLLCFSVPLGPNLLYYFNVLSVSYKLV